MAAPELRQYRPLSEETRNEFQQNLRLLMEPGDAGEMLARLILRVNRAVDAALDDATAVFTARQP